MVRKLPIIVITLVVAVFAFGAWLNLRVPETPENAAVGGMVVNSTISYAVDGKQYVMVFTGRGQSVTSGPLGLTADTLAPAAGPPQNAIYVFALP